MAKAEPWINDDVGHVILRQEESLGEAVLRERDPVEVVLENFSEHALTMANDDQLASSLVTSC